MRIQHNIMAMSAYRNYTNNVSSMKKNLEKLSSGYKINRAGDDAAGLAISEKMRAQITGLETAQKNAKDGISLVQTAEGALTEVHDMLNRMVELASMSANGTYDDTTDRAQLQKEMDQLTSEIDRIADSSNFNGIKLLNGNMQDGFDTKTAAEAALAAAKTALETAKTNAAKPVPDVTETLTGNADTANTKSVANLLKPLASGNNPGTPGTNTVLESNAGGGTKPSFTVALDGLKHNVKDPTETFKLTVAGQEVKKDGASVQVGGDKFASLTSTQLAQLFDGAKVTVDGMDYTAKATAGSSNVVFTADATPAAGQVKNPKADVTFTAVGKTAAAVNNGAVAKYTIDLAGWNTNDGDTSIDGETLGFTTDAATSATAFVKAYNAANHDYTASVNGTEITLTAKSAGAKANAPVVAGTFSNMTADAKMVEATKGVDAGTGTTGAAAVYTVDLTGGTEAGLDTAGATIDGVDITWNNDLNDTLNDFVATYNADASKDYVASTDGTTVTLTARSTGAVGAGAAPAVTNMDDIDGTGKEITAMTEATKGKDTMDPEITGTTGSINVGTVNINFNTAATEDRLANTVLNLTGKFKDGTEIKLGNETYIIATTADGKQVADAAAAADATKKVVDLTGLDSKANNFEELAASKLTQVAKDNAIFSVGQTGTAGQISLQQKSTARTENFETMAGLTAKISVKYTRAATADETAAAQEAAQAAVTAAEAKVKEAQKAADNAVKGSSLTLQIGDTAEDFNQLKVDIKDMHATSLGIDKGKINIADQDSAAKAISEIKKAINMVSDVRGTLGATQNRLDHTINNLSVMTENIQDAESTIRDTDVADEMMAYTKNNILIQSAQAMLAQANQVPQGVLQLLQ